MSSRSTARTEIDLRTPRLLASGKVREVYELGGDILLVASDRVSAFDVVFERGIPGKGEILTRVATFWFDTLSGLGPHHLLSTEVDEWPELDEDEREVLRGRTMRCRRLEILPIEWVVRGHLTGSGFRDYESSGRVSGIELPLGLEHASELDPPILTPSTKAESGHDEPISFDEVVNRVGRDLAEQARDRSIQLFVEGRRLARERGFVLADTKFEFGLHEGELVLADECLTPDSSRYWAADEVRPGAHPKSFDKEVLRSWARGSGWDLQPPAPALPDEVIDRVRSTYLALERQLLQTGGSLDG
ncbi:MAG: phosphoribosylaminoimidazolesuccinocarboxamide synthase [Planctomycetota bacterium]